MAAEHTPVEFLDPDDDSGDIELLDLDESDEERLAGERDPSLLPAHASRRRAIASLVALALWVTGVGGWVTAAYHRHQTDVRIANLLSLQDTEAVPSIPALPALGAQAVWRSRPTERVLVSVINKSPEPVTLLNGVLDEPGMTTPATLAPVGAATLRVGQTGQIAGNVTVDCTEGTSTADAVIPQNSTSTGVATVTASAEATANSPAAPLLVRARTSGGSIGLQRLQPDVGGQNLQQRICSQEEGNVFGTFSTSTTGDLKTHVISLTLSTSSVADIPLTYAASASYSADPEADGNIIAPNPRPALPVTGTVKPGGGLRVAFSIPVTSCPATPPPSTDNILVFLIFTSRGNVVGMFTTSVEFDSVLADACG